MALVCLPLGLRAQDPIPGPEPLQTVEQPNLEGRPEYQRDPQREFTPLAEVPENPEEAVQKRVLLDRTRIGVEGLRRGLSLQPKVLLGGHARGLRGFWDSAEFCPPQALKVGKQWEPEAGATDLRLRRFGDLDDPELKVHFDRRGCVFYHDLVRLRDGVRFFLHRYFYYFPWGTGGVGQSLDPHVVWVELWERLDPGEAERAQMVARARRDLLESRALLEKQVPRPEEPLRQIQELLDGEIQPPHHLAIQKVVISDPMPVRGGQAWSLRTYPGESLSFREGRPVFYLTEGNHRLLASRAELGWTEECDPPFHLETKNGKLPMIDLRDYQNPDNPLAARAKGAEIPLLEGFIDNLAFMVGFEEAARVTPEAFGQDK